ncbi:MAG TPA: Rieske (2Fe-2S) protein [Candidatus Limnocylindria bacterium]
MTDRPEHDPQPDAQADPGAPERFERYVDALLAGGRPSPDDIAGRDEAEMARLAAEMSAAVDPDAGPDPAFLEQLRARMRDADRGIAAAREPLPLRPATGGDRGVIRLSRRQLLQGGLIGAAGIAAGALGASVLRPTEPGRDPIWSDGTALISGEGEWVQVASTGDLPEGSALRFSTAAFDGYVVNDAGEIRALSSVCTHMGCTLRWRSGWKDFRCPCHGASFDLKGQLANGRSRWRQTGGYANDERAYPIELPDLIRPAVKVDGERILVWTAKQA